MSVLCCRIPEFLITLALRRAPALAGVPLGLQGGDERVWAVSPSALSSGVLTGMTARQARVRCPDLLLRPLDLEESQAEQEHFLGEMTRWELPVEEQGWGAAWLDLHTVATAADDVCALAAELGGRVRAAMGPLLQPALGWDSSKFTSRAAATCAAAGAMRMVGKAEESHFLSPLSITLLPLPEDALQQLHWLGIRTLGQYAALPPTAVWRRYGQAGKLAQRWALGKDNRPVCGNLRPPPETFEVEIEPASDQSGRVLAEIMLVLHPRLRVLAATLSGIRRLRLTLHFLAAGVRTLEVIFVEPSSHPARIEAAVAQQLGALVWPGEVERVEVNVLESGELPAGQLNLFAEPVPDVAPVMALAQQLSGRYGRCFFQGQILEANHPVAERASRLQPA